LRLRGGMQIFVRTLSYRIFTLEVDASEIWQDRKRQGNDSG
jgi:hypothetical protein